MNARFLMLSVVLFLPQISWGQGYGGLGRPAEGFDIPDRDTRLEFPADDGAHPDFRVEWWYLTANLVDGNGADLGVQWTLFRNGLARGNPTGWDNRQVWMAHAAATTKDAHHFEERFSRGGTGAAGVIAQPFEAWLDDWRFAQDPQDVNAFHLVAGSGDFSFDLRLGDDGTRVLQGTNGYSVKSPTGTASHYYSRPNYAVSGQMRVGPDTFEVTGTAWMDHEWSSQPLTSAQAGWDWFGLSLDDGGRLMVARVRGETDFVFGSFIAPDGTVKALGPQDVVISPTGDGEVSTTWEIALPEYQLDLKISALNPASWTGRMFPYWEGPVKVTGSHSGHGYLEMTGYQR